MCKAMLSLPTYFLVFIFQIVEWYVSAGNFITPLLSVEFIHLFRFAVGMSTRTYSSSQVVFVVSRTASVGRVSPRDLHLTKI